MTDVLVFSDLYACGVNAPGQPGKHCGERGCVSHTYDWRERPGSAKNTHRIRPGEAITVQQAMTHRFPKDAMLAGYALYGSDGALVTRPPRIRKGGRAWVEAEGYRLGFNCLFADIDNPPSGALKHGPWTSELRAVQQQQWNTLGVLRTAGCYLGRGGWRIVQPLADTVPIELAEDYLAEWHDELRAGGIDVDGACRDWTRLYRAPYARREGAIYCLEAPTLERMVPVGRPVPAPRTAPARRVSARRTKVTIPEGYAAEPPPEWTQVRIGRVADAVRRVEGNWHELFMVLSGALLERGVAPSHLPALCGAISAATGSDSRTADRIDAAQSTVALAAGNGHYLGDVALRSRWPELAAVLDACMVTPTEARIRRELQAPAPAWISAGEAQALLAKTLERAYGVIAIEAPPGTGKTHSVVELARRLPVIASRAAPGSRVAVAAPRHNLAQQTAAKLSDRSLHLFSPPSLVDAKGNPVCHFAGSGHALAAGRQSVRVELCDGRGKASQACPHAAHCTAKDGQEGNERGNLVVGVHGLVRQLRHYAGPNGLLVVDEPGEITTIETLSLDALETARRYLDAFVDDYAASMAPLLAAVTAWVRELGPLEGPLVTLQAAATSAAGHVPSEDLDRALIDPETPALDLGTAILVAAAGAFPADARSHAPRLKWQSVARARTNPARASELGEASRVLDLLWRGVTDRVPPALRLDDRRGARTASVVGINADLLTALRHEGPVVILDANAGLHLAAIAKVLGHPPELVRLHVADGAPIARTVLACGGASRTAWLPRGVPDWSSGLLTALRAAVAWIVRDPTTRAVGLIAPKIVAAAVAHALNPDDPTPLKAWGHSRKSLEQARLQLAPVLSPLRSLRVLVGHFGALEGLDHMSDCDATVTLMDPRPNLGDEALRAEFLGLDAEGRVDELAAAELQQAHGRLRTIHRTRPGRQLHVGALVPAGWQGLEVTVERLHAGRPRTVAAMTAEEFAELRAQLGLSARALGASLRVTHTAIARYESGERAVPEDVARALRALVQSGTETPSRKVYP